MGRHTSRVTSKENYEYSYSHIDITAWWQLRSCMKKLILAQKFKLFLHAVSVSVRSDAVLCCYRY